MIIDHDSSRHSICQYLPDTGPTSIYLPTYLPTYLPPVIFASYDLLVAGVLHRSGPIDHASSITLLQLLLLHGELDLSNVI